MSHDPRDTYSDEPRRRPARRDDYDDAPRRRRPPASGSGSKVVLIIGGIFLLGFCCIGLICGGGGYVAYDRAKELQTRRNNLKEMGLAFHNYYSVHARFPPAMPLKRSEIGQTNSHLSWRVHLLPYLEQVALYNRFKLDEPWDSPTNLALLKEMPRIYMKPGDPPDTTTTHYRVFVGPGTIWDSDTAQPSLASIQDGTSNTILVVEATDAVPWTKPDELQFNPAALPSLGLPGKDRFECLMADGSVISVRTTVNKETLKKAITARGGEVLDAYFELQQR